MAAATYNLSCVLRRAWDLARIGARRFGGTVRQYLPEAMRLAWAHEKATVVRLVAQEERIRETADFLVSVQQAAKARREAAHQETMRLLRERQAIPTIRPPVADPDTLAWLARLGAAQQREAAAKVAAEVGRAA